MPDEPVPEEPLPEDELPEEDELEPERERFQCFDFDLDPDLEVP